MQRPLRARRTPSDEAPRKGQPAHLLLFILAALHAACGVASPAPESPAAPLESSTRAPRFPVIYIDMDGTLLGDDHEPRAASLEALADYQACGGRFGIATGRTAEQVRPYLDRLHPDLPLVLFNGAVVMDPTAEEILFANPLETAHIGPLLERLGADERVMTIFLSFSDRTWVYPDAPGLAELAARIHTEIDRVCDSPESCVPPESDDGSPLLKMLVITHGDVAQALASSVTEYLPEGIRAVVGFPSALEIIAADVNKAAAIRRVLSERGLSVDETLVFGDSGNDVEMVTEIPVSIAMEGCHPQTCGAALLRGGDNDTDTIARVIRSLAMGPGCR